MVLGTDDIRKRRPPLVDRVELWLSTRRIIDGLWVGTFEAEPTTVLDRVEEALALIRTYDRVRYASLIRDLKRVWVRALIGQLGNFNASFDACELDIRFVRDPASRPEMIAATIVHEVTHARLARRGIGYEESVRARIEAVCARREMAFARKIPDGRRVRDRAEQLLLLCGDNALWSDAAFDERLVEGAPEVLRGLGAPMWVARTIVTLSSPMVSRRILRGRHRLRWRRLTPR